MLCASLEATSSSDGQEYWFAAESRCPARFRVPTGPARQLTRHWHHGCIYSVAGALQHELATHLLPHTIQLQLIQRVWMHDASAEDQQVDL